MGKMTRTATSDRNFWAAAWMIAAGAVLYCSWPLAYWLNPAAYRRGLASEFGAVGQPYSWLFMWADIVSGILLVIAVGLLLRGYVKRRWAKTCLVALATYGACGALDAGLPLSCLPSERVCRPVLHDPLLILHGMVDIAGSIALIITLIAAWLYVRRANRQWTLWVYIIGGAGLVFALLSGILLVTSGPGYWAQRYYLTLSSVWVITIPFLLNSRHDQDMTKPRVASKAH
jgi:hypothetical protein